MKDSVYRCVAALAVTFVLLTGSVSAVVALQVHEQARRFDTLVVADATSSLDVATTPVGSLPASDNLRSGWEMFRGAHGASWSIYLDRRSGAPLLVEGPGIPWQVGAGATIDSLASSIRGFMSGNRALLLADDGELVLDRDASVELMPDVWQIVFDRVVSGVPVAGEGYLFTIGHGSLISFGSPRWSRIDASPSPEIASEEAFARLSAYMGLTTTDVVNVLGKATLQFIPTRAAAPPSGSAAGPYAGRIGSGYGSALVWRIAVRVEGEPGTWVALVDAHTGIVRSFVDDNRYARVKGGVYPVSDDQICPDGCEQPNYPMPFTNAIILGVGTQTTTTMGQFNCTPGGSTARTTLNGPYVKVLDSCGAISQQVTCDADLDLQTSGGINCTVPVGSSAGNTHAARSSFYHLNRIAEHARSWLPTNAWLLTQLTDNVNIVSTCNAYWDGVAVNFFRAGGGCNNTGELTGVTLHEWGHGMDQNDGGGFDNPSEAYADVTAFLSTHASCVGRGFRSFATCGGYGNTCLSCTGIRDQDWDQRADHTPSTPAGFLTNNCPGGGGPCGKEEHCEGYVGAETIWDLGARDLPASGLDPATSWQIVDKLWYKSRAGSGGNAYSCSLPSSDGCAATSWFSKLRAIDDDDGNLANGTPHGAAIFAAFDRHKIACGTAGAASNKSTTICPPIGATALSAVTAPASAQLSWTPVANATGYKILRNDAGCAAGFTAIATVAGTGYNDTTLVNGFSVYYAVQAVGANAACDGLVSNCQSVTPQPFYGSVRLDSGTYGCSGLITVTVTDLNIGASTTTVSLVSTTETTAETITLTQIAPGSDTYTGTIALTGGDPASDGLLSLADGGTITATYIDASDGAGGVDLPRLATAVGDCALPLISKVEASNVTGSSARITWTTNEPATSVVHFGATPPPASTIGLTPLVLGHGVDLTGLAECTPYVFSAESADVVANTTIDDASGAYHAFSTGKSSQPAITSTDTPVAIPDNSSVGALSTITVSDARTVRDVDVKVNLTHTFDSDLTITLLTPTGLTITLANPHGGSGDNYTNTVFDDEAATPIASGSPPFTGSFRPDAPLSAADGANGAGNWTLRVADRSPQDIGTIDNWTLTPTFATSPCGPHAVHRSHAKIADTCSFGGAGDANTYWDAGEQVQFKVNIGNDGTTTLTGITATVTSTTPGVVLVDGTASFPDLTEGASSDSLVPHFTATLPSSLTCGGTVAFQLAITNNEGSFSGAFVQSLGHPVGGTGTVLDETFSAGIPATWTIVDGGSGGGLASKWTASNPGVRPIAAPMFLPVTTVDSDNAGPGASQDEGLITPLLNLTPAAAVTLQFDQYFRWHSGGQNEIADVDVRSSATGGSWVNVLRQQGAGSANPDHKTLDISAEAAGAPDAQVRFRDYDGSNEWYWQLDNVKIDTSAPGSCDMPVCAVSQPGNAKPVADGTFGSAMTGSRADAIGSTIDLIWDVATCASSDHHVLYGPLASVATATISGAFCDLGASGSAVWTGIPAGDLWFVVVGDDNATVEASWGKDKSGAQRGGTTASLQCGTTTRDNSGTCP